MAYMGQKEKASLAPGIKKVLAKFGMKGSLSIQNHSTLVLKVKSGKIDFSPFMRDPKRGLDVNHYWIADHFDGKAKDFLVAVKEAMMVGNYDHSDSMTDYFCVGWYISIRIGEWNKPYVKV